MTQQRRRCLELFIKCPHLLQIVSSVLVLLCSGLSATHEAADSCLFDKIKVPSSSLTRCSLAYEETHVTRKKRSLEDIYQPIRVKLLFYNLDEYLNQVEIENLEQVMTDTVNTVTNLFKVVPVDGPLLLARSRGACSSRLQSGINQGKCTTSNPSYTGEECLDSFQVPQDHLEGLYLYNETHPEPVRTLFSQGAGIEDTDYVLYVRSIPSPACVRQGFNIISYAAYCQVDQNDRPVAGYINFCPSLLRTDVFDYKRVSLTALHEVFHALGFASDLFSKFKDCVYTGTSLECTDKRKTVSLVQDAYRLITPKVVNLTSGHFGCRTHQTINEFGPILQTENNNIKSHWDAAFMHGSLMTPVIGMVDSTILDPITLALFEDSGWYQVNYEFADTFTWGKGAGCLFGQNPYCEVSDSKYFCSDSTKGCSFLHLDKGTCDTDAFLHHCRIYKASGDDSCQNINNSPPEGELSVSGEFYGETSRCFQANITKVPINLTVTIDHIPTKGYCFDQYCNGSDVFIKLGSEPHQICPPGDFIQVHGYLGRVLCPSADILCQKTEVASTVPTTAPMPTTRHPVIVDDADIVCVDIIYENANIDLTNRKSVLFQHSNLETILMWTRISRRRLENFYVLPEEVIFRFDLLPKLYSDDGRITVEVLNILYAVVRNGSFTFFLTPRGPKYIATGIRQMAGGPSYSDKKLPGSVIAGVVVGSIAGAVVLGVLVFYIQKYHNNRSRIEANRRRNAAQNMHQHQELRVRPPLSGPHSRSFSDSSRPHDPPRSLVRSEDPHMRAFISPMSQSGRSRFARPGDIQTSSPNLDDYNGPCTSTDMAGIGGHTSGPSHNFPPIIYHRPSISSIVDDDTHSIGPISISSDISEFTPPPSRSRTPQSDREFDQNGITMFI